MEVATPGLQRMFNRIKKSNGWFTPGLQRMFKGITKSNGFRLGYRGCLKGSQRVMGFAWVTDNV